MSAIFGLATDGRRSATLILVIGLPGSGKSHLIRRLAGSCTGPCVEDYHMNARNESPSVTASRHFEALVQALRNGQSCAIADVAFTDPRRRRDAEETFRRHVPGLSVIWVFFANDLDPCVANIRRRGRPEADTEERLAVSLSATYRIPRGAAMVPVWKPAEHGEGA